MWGLSSYCQVELLTRVCIYGSTSTLNNYYLNHHNFTFSFSSSSTSLEHYALLVTFVPIRFSRQSSRQPSVHPDPLRSTALCFYLVSSSTGGLEPEPVSALLFTHLFPLFSSFFLFSLLSFSSLLVGNTVIESIPSSLYSNGWAVSTWFLSQVSAFFLSFPSPPWPSSSLAFP